METKMTIVDNQGIEHICDVIARWDMDNASYVAYTMGNNKDDLLINRYTIELDEVRLESIIDPNEWKKVNDYLDKCFEEVA